jgi:hypothetical protein
MVVKFPDNFPTICEFCGIPDSIDPDASVPEREALLKQWCVLIKSDINETLLVRGVDSMLHQQVFDLLYANIIYWTGDEIATYEEFKETTLDLVDFSAFVAMELKKRDYV